MSKNHTVPLDTMDNIVTEVMYLSSTSKRVSVITEIVDGKSRTLFKVQVGNSVAYTEYPREAVLAYNTGDVRNIKSNTNPPIQPIE